ncbi:MAG: large subunit ribosomal protein [Actinomycetota bacterium]|jgi:large subunit ribosomal protein L29|nr:large subunit ribosomal protein [Actinomycetota bacterium]
MAKASELRELPVDEIRQRLKDTKEELFNLRFQNATGQLDNYKRLGDLKRDVARINTILRQHELTEEEVPADE